MQLRTIAKQQHLNTQRWIKINRACQIPDDTDSPIEQHELDNIKHKGKDTAPGADKITYTILNNLGPQGDKYFIHLVTQNLKQHKRPDQWSNRDIQPIPKPNDPENPRPISLISCLAKNEEKIMLNRLKWKVGELHPNLFAYTKGRGATDCITAILSTINQKTALVICMDLEKAFELASAPAILENLVNKGVKGDLLAWTKQALSNQKARVKFQGITSEYKNL